MIAEPADATSLEKMLYLPPTQRLEAELAALGGVETRQLPRVAERAECLERMLASAQKRDEILAGRPDGCWCLGSGVGRDSLRLSHTGVAVYVDHCGCAEGNVRKAADEAALEAEESARRSANVERFRESLPRHFALASLASFHAMVACDRQRAVLAEIERWLAGSDDELRWMFLHGPYGTGKTGLALAAGAAAIERGLINSATFVVAPDLLDRLRHTYPTNVRENERDVMQKYREAELLVLDDLGSERNSDFAVERLFVLLNYRHDEHLPTIITSNLGPVALGKHVGDRVMHRVAELARVVSTEGCPDLRAQARRARLVKSRGDTA